ncbi:MAG: heparinase II/III family protein, partial [Planctomycetota bacterium]
MAEGQAYRQYRRDIAPAFFFAPGQMPSGALVSTAGARAEADDVLKGRFRYFTVHECQLGFPPDWMLNPITGQQDSAARHWCDRDDFEPERGDIKWYWEPARFTWAFALVRAYAATGDEKYPEGFWSILESFLAANPPQMGPNWQCGQETALRAMACSMALYAFVASPSATPARLGALAKMLAFSGERIEGNIAYALSQRSNHATTEAAGLLTLGLLFPEFSSSARWRSMGFNQLCAEALAHNWTDGSYVQHSMNYQRMTLHCHVWAIRLAEQNSVEFPADVRNRVAASAAFLYALQDDCDGR